MVCYISGKSVPQSSIPTWTIKISAVLCMVLCSLVAHVWWCLLRCFLMDNQSGEWTNYNHSWHSLTVCSPWTTKFNCIFNMHGLGVSLYMVQNYSSFCLCSTGSNRLRMSDLVILEWCFKCFLSLPPSTMFLLYATEA